MSATMKAVVIHEAGDAEVLRIERHPIPKPDDSQVLIRVKAFGLNRSELFTRQGHSPSVTFPRILGIEAVGIVEEAPGKTFKRGDVVATAMGGMGRLYDGGYAEFTCVPATQVQKLETILGWDVLGALPEAFQTAHGSLFKSLRLAAGERILIRGGTTSVGLVASILAKAHGATVVSTTRNPERIRLLRQYGADMAVVDTGKIEEQIKEFSQHGVDKVLELIGANTLEDSLSCTKPNGAVCMAGMVGNNWLMETFSPMGVIPTAVNLTTYAGDADDFMRTPLQKYIDQIEAGFLIVPIGKVFPFDKIVEAHQFMEDNLACGKIVVTID